MWSRLASRIMLPLGQCSVYSDLDLYLGVQAIPWTEIFSQDATFAVHFSGLNEEIRNSQYGALKVKDAIVDSFTRKNLPRPNVDRENPDLRINVWLNKETAHISWISAARACTCAATATGPAWRQSKKTWPRR